MMEILRNMWRRKFRTFLTITGIVVGIFAFTVMGSMALKLNKMIDGGKKYITGQISIMPKGTDFASGQMGGMLPIDTLNNIAKVEGVEAVEGSVGLAVNEPNPDEPVSVNMGQPSTIYSLDTNSNFKNKNWETLDMKEGKLIDKDSADNDISIGTTVALDKGWKVGDKVTIRGKEFNVVGLLDKTMTGPDSYVFMKLPVARELYIDANPFLKSLRDRASEAGNISDKELAKLSPEARNQIIQAKTFKVEDVSTSAAVSWKDGVDPEQVVARIKDQFKDEVVVLSPKLMGEQIDKASATMNAIIYGAAMLALIVGIFSITNTMVMSISERTKEIGIKKAIGASGRSISLEYTLEAGVISLIGGLLGMGIGTTAILIINSKMASKGAEIFLINANFLIGVVAFSFVIGIIAGIIPAARAAKLKVVDAIREL